MRLFLAITALDALSDAVGESLWTYPAIVGAVALDSILPLAPGEAVVIAAGVLAADGELNVVVAARFIPGGRTATTFSSGALAMPWRRFATIDAVAASLWAGYATALGYFGGSTFEQSLWKPLLAAGLVAILVAAGAEGLRRLRLS